MNFDLDILLASVFIIGTVILGVYKGRNVKTEREYAIGNSDWSLSALVASIISCWVGGEKFFVDLENIYSTGLHFMIVSVCQILGILLIAYIFIPRMKEFLGDLSMAESLGKLYGKRIRVISAVTGSLAAIGLMAVQFKIFGLLFTQYFGINHIISVILGALLIISYTVIGGIRSVTITDMLKVFIFAAILIPILSASLWNEYITLNGFSFEAATKSPLFDIGTYFQQDKFWHLFWILLLFIMPGLHPSIYQRIIMGRSVSQVQKAFIISALILSIILIGISSIGFLLFNLYPDLVGGNVAYYIIENMSPPGLKGLIIMGIVAMCMSNADSNLNSASILVSHDIFKPLGYDDSENPLAFAKKITIFVGIVAILIAYTEYDFLSMILISLSLNVPIVSPSLLLAILGFRSSEKSVLIGMVADFV